MKDIAEALGVSIVTVSKALRNHPDIAKETRERVLQKVKETNYRPNLMARSLVTGRSSLIGLVVPDLIHPFFAEIAKSLSGALRKKNLFLIVASSDGDPTLEQAEIEHMLAHRLDAMIVASCQTVADGLRQVAETGPPLILLDRMFAGFPTNFVGGDDYKIGQLAAEHLLASGRRRIAHIHGPANNVGQHRWQGFRETLQKAGVSVPAEYLIEPDWGPGAGSNGENLGQSAMTELLALKVRPDAVFCFNDTVAVGALSRAFEAGLAVPAEMAMMGCGELPLRQPAARAALQRRAEL